MQGSVRHGASEELRWVSFIPIAAFDTCNPDVSCDSVSFPIVTIRGSRNMLIAEILRGKGSGVQTTTAQATLQSAINVLASERIGVLVVSSNGRSIDGILSERDIVRGLANESADFGGYAVGDLMTSKVFTCSPDDTVASVMELMDEKRIRHVPVAVNNELAGVVSIRDVLHARLREAEAEQKEMAGYIAGSPPG